MGIDIEPKFDTSQAIESTPPTGFFRGNSAYFSDAFSSGLLSSEVKNIRNSYNDIFDPGDYIPSSQFKDSPYYRPGLSAPSGVYSNVAALNASRWDEDAKRDDIIANIPSSAVNTISKYISSGAGFMLDPGNVAASIAAPELIGTKRALSAIAATDASRATLAIKGAQYGISEGALVMGANAALGEEQRRSEGESPDVLNSLYSIGFGAALGGLVHGVVGYKTPIGSVLGAEISREAKVAEPASSTSDAASEIPGDVSVSMLASRDFVSPEGSNLSNQVAVSQMMSDRNVNTSQILKIGYNDGGKTLSVSPIYPSDIESASGKLSEPSITSEEVLSNRENLSRAYSELADASESYKEAALNLQDHLDAVEQSRSIPDEKYLKDLEDAKNELATKNSAYLEALSRDSSVSPRTISGQIIKSEHPYVEDPDMSHSAMQYIVNHPSVGVELSDTINQALEHNSPLNDSAIDASSQSAYSDLLETIPDDNLPNYDKILNEAQSLKEKGLMDEEASSLFDDLDKEESKLSAVINALSHPECIGGL